MSRITTVPIDAADAVLIIHGGGRLTSGIDISYADRWPSDRQMVEPVLMFLTQLPSTAPWGTYITIDGPENRFVGGGAFKGSSGHDSAVEIAYFTLPSCESRGVATETVRRLMSVAAGVQSGPEIIRAHTLPFRNASVRVLEKLEFTFMGDVMDPDDGIVWRWERALRS